jgi:outer membrane murein-binding lipoprotein Lpp
MKKPTVSKMGLIAAGLSFLLLGGCAAQNTERLDALEAAVSRAQSAADAAMSTAKSAQSDASAAQSAANAAQDAANNAVTTAQRLTESCCRK